MSRRSVRSHRGGVLVRARHLTVGIALGLALDQIANGFFSPEEPDRFRPIIDALLHQGDRYFLLADYASYIAGHVRADMLYRNPDEWVRKAVLNVAGMGSFSSDRAVAEYAEEIWRLTPMSI